MINKKQSISWLQDSVTDKANPMALKRRAIGPDGQVVEISLATGKTITNRIGNAYADIIEHSKQRLGWLFYDECKVGCDEIDIENGNAELCKSCEFLKKEIVARRSKKAKQNAEYAEGFKTNMDRLADVLAKSNAVNADPATAIVAEMAKTTVSQKPKKKAF